MATMRGGLTALPLEFVRAVRPRQWTKNLVVYLALLFTLNEAWETSGLAGAAARQPHTAPLHAA